MFTFHHRVSIYNFSTCTQVMTVKRPYTGSTKIVGLDIDGLENEGINDDGLDSEGLILLATSWAHNRCDIAY